METIRKGYKQTDIGIIPEDWEVKRLGDIAEITKLAGFEYSKYFNSYQDGGEIIVVRGTNITNNYLDLNDVRYIPRRTSEFLKRSKLHTNDLVFAYVGTIGPVFLITENDRYHLGPNTCRITLKEQVLPHYAFAYFKGALIINEINDHISIGAQPSLSMSKIRKFRIIAPSIYEQRAIAEVLSDIDSLIEVLDKKIAKKQAIKDGAMQELFTTKKRLPGFSDPWIEKKLGDISNIKTGSRNGEECTIDGVYPFFVRSQIIQRINSYSFDGEAILVPGEGGIGDIFHYVSGRFDYRQRVYKISNFEDSIDCKFVFYYLKRYFGNYALQQTVKATVDSLRLPTFTNFEIRLPKSKKEQQAISEILTDMDSEIELLEQQRSKYTALKQGAMQQLLTGQIRLFVDRQIRQTDKSPKQANVHFKRSVWAAEIADRLCNEPTFGHVKMEKMIFLTEHLCGVDIGSNYHRDAAGPYDNRAIRSIDSQLKKQNWFEAIRNDKGYYHYTPLVKRGGHKEYFNKYFSGVQADFDKVINTFRNWNTERCEIVATLYSAWKDIASAQKSYSDEDIINEVLNNWHESKKRISIERWQLALKWMKEKGFEPKL